jgi:hypothetical protein
MIRLGKPAAITPKGLNIWSWAKDLLSKRIVFHVGSRTRLEAPKK